jgi:aminoglycoside phosphotransferase family enzyme/predicted kinase
MTHGNDPETEPEADQTAVIAFLADPATHAGTHLSSETVDRFDTHGNLVFLAGCDAWKIKRAVRFPYMDFSTLEKRREACAREVAINRRLAPGIYLGCVPITRSSDGKLAIGGDGEAVEWAVHMRRFGQADLLVNIAAAGGVPSDLARAVADTVLESHRGAEIVTTAAGAEQMRQLTASLSRAFARLEVFETRDVARFTRDCRAQLDRASATLDERARRGCVRRCHGDLHLRNIVLWQGRPALFDAVEFDDAIATVDTLYDLAFLLMDLDRQRQRPAANVVLNRYLWRANDEQELTGLLAMPLFLACRAGVRAMVTAERAAQEIAQPGRATADRELARAYLRAALGYLAPAPPRLLAVAGLSGTGKTTLAARIAPQLGSAPGAVHLRSDLERKSLFGVGETERLPSNTYTIETSDRVYDILRRKAGLALAAGHAVIIDAVSARPHERSDIDTLARDLKVPFRGLWLTAAPEDLTARVDARRNDASDATSEVVRRQLAWQVGELSEAWIPLNAGGSPDDVLRLAEAALASW